MEVAGSPVDPLKRAHQRGKEVFHICPFHDDGTASLRINTEKDVWRCDPCGIGGNAWGLAAARAGCDASDKKTVLAWFDSHGLGSGNNGNGGSARKIVATYDYRGLDGQVRHQSVRYEPKGF